MNIILIEDDEFKKNNISKLLLSKYDHFIDQAESVNEGLTKLTNNNYDLVILDMSLPTFPATSIPQSNRPQGYGGREILRQMDRFDITIPTIVITQYAKFDESNEIMSLAELTKQLEQEHGHNVINVIYYNSSSEDWKSELISSMNKLG